MIMIIEWTVQELHSNLLELAVSHDFHNLQFCWTLLVTIDYYNIGKRELFDNEELKKCVEQQDIALTNGLVIDL